MRCAVRVRACLRLEEVAKPPISCIVVSRNCGDRNLCCSDDVQVLEHLLVIAQDAVHTVPLAMDAGIELGTLLRWHVGPECGSKQMDMGHTDYLFLRLYSTRRHSPGHVGTSRCRRDVLVHRRRGLPRSQGVLAAQSTPGAIAIRIAGDSVCRPEVRDSL